MEGRGHCREDSGPMCGNRLSRGGFSEAENLCAGRVLQAFFDGGGTIPLYGRLHRLWKVPSSMPLAQCSDEKRPSGVGQALRHVSGVLSPLSQACGGVWKPHAGKRAICVSGYRTEGSEGIIASMRCSTSSGRREKKSMPVTVSTLSTLTMYFCSDW